MPRKKRRIPLEMRPLGECTLKEICAHLQTRDQIICVLSAIERQSGETTTYIDNCAYSGQLFELVNNLIQAVKEYHAKEGDNAPDLSDDEG